MLDDSASATPTLMAIDAYIFRARLRLAKGPCGGGARGLGEACRVQLGPRATLRWRSRLSPHGPRSCTRPGNPRRRPRRSTSSSLDGAKVPRPQRAPGSRSWRMCSKGSGEAPSSARQARVCACGRGGSAPQKPMQAATRSAPPRCTTEIGAHADAAMTRLRAAELLVAADQRDGGREPARARARVLPRARAPSATSARPRRFSRSASRRPGRDRRLRAGGSHRDPAARRTR